MIPGIFPLIIKQHGSVKYLKYVILTYRFSGNKSKNPSKILAASSLSPASIPEKHDSHKKKKPSSIIKVINGNNSSESFASTDNVSISKPEIALQFLKPASKPDFTNIPQKSSDEVAKDPNTINLLNAVRPSDLEWQRQSMELKFLPQYYKSLSKYRLTGLVVLTTLAGYGMAPGVIEPTSVLCMIIGTALMSAAANSINQFLEVPYDSQMARTKNRVLTRGLITPFHAFTFAACSATIGLSTLYFGTNALTAALGATNLILYTSVYTPLKRCSIANTWLGSVVGAIPPMMGWTACTGSLNAGGLLLGAILYAWQFPHFNALSWNLRSEYSRAGYRMTSVIDPALCQRTALRYSVLILGLCTLAPVMDLTTWTFAFDTFPLNCYLIYCSWQFYRKGDSASSRKLFRLSLIHLPTLMFLMFVGKKYTSTEKNDKCTS